MTIAKKKQVNIAMGPRYEVSQVKQAKSKKSSKLIRQEYFGVITQNRMIFLLASMGAKNQLDTSCCF